MEINLDTNEPSLWDFNLSLQSCQTTIDVGSILHGIWARIITSIESFIGTSYQPAVVTEYIQNILCKQVYLVKEDDMKTKSGYRWAFHSSVKKMEQQHFLSHHHNQLMDGVLGDGAHKVVLSDVRLYIHLRAREQRSNCKGLELSPISLFPSMSVLKRVVQYRRQKQCLYNLNNLESHFLVRPHLFCNTAVFHFCK